MTHLTHYIVVRRDLPFGVVLAQVTHAAGESFYMLADVAQCRKSSGEANPQVTSSNLVVGSNSFPGSSSQSAEAQAAEVAGSIPAPGAIFDPSKTFAIVLGARNESRLLKLERALLAAGVPHVAVREPDSPYNGQLTAIGLAPALKEDVAPRLRDFHMFVSAAVAGEAAP